MSLEDYDYQIIIKTSICNMCNKQKTCIQCNDCFVMTCNDCILGTTRNPRFPKCNNCNHIFVELKIIDNRYNIVLNKYIDKFYKHVKKELYKFHDIKLEETKLLLQSIQEKLFTLSISIMHNIVTNRNLYKLLKTVIDVNKTILKYEKLCTFNNYSYKYLPYYEQYPVIHEINNLLFEIYIHTVYKYVCNFNEYYEPTFNKIKYYLHDYTINGEFDYSKKCHETYVNRKCDIYMIIKKMTNAKSVRECSIQSHPECNEKICKYYYNYYKDNPNYLLCTVCNIFNPKFENCQQAYCRKCMILYDSITLKPEEFILNAYVYDMRAAYFTNLHFVNDIEFTYRLHERLDKIQLNSYIKKLPADIRKLLKTNISVNSNIYKIFLEQRGLLIDYNGL